jgi:DNA polymerase III alpha subunit (gram-positive type)
MIYVSIDTETTGLNPENCQLLEFGAIIEDTTKKLPFEELPKFKRLIFHEEIKGNPFALNMNSRILSIFAEYQSMHDKFVAGKVTEDEMKNFVAENNITSLENLASSFYSFLVKNGFESGKKIELNVAGKNFGMFDYGFLKLVPRMEELFRFKSRVLDPAILCVDWNEDKALPSLNDCKQRHGIEGEVTHDAVEDAWDVIQVLRKFY